MSPPNSEPTPLDRIRLRLEGRLTPAQAAELERELAADPELGALAEDYALVRGVTALESAHVAARTRFEELEERLTPRPARWRRSAAAAALLLFGAAGGFLLASRLRPDAQAALGLVAIDLDAPLAGPAVTADLPASWSGFEPRGEHGVRFLSDLAEARELARFSARPLLVYGSLPGCPQCAELDRLVFADPRVIALAERTVPVRLDLSVLPTPEQRSYMMRGYPFLEVWRADGRAAQSLARAPDPLLFLESLHDGLEQSDAIGELPEWSALAELVERFRAARAAELEGRLARAESEFRALALDARVPGEIATRADAGLRRLGDEARERLLAAGEQARTDEHAALAELALAARRFAGTRYAFDLEAAHARLAREGRFPALVELAPPR